MFTVQQREALRDRLLRLAQADARVVAGAAVGSLALGGGDRFSDLDLTFAIADPVPLADVLADWTRTLRDELAAVPLADLVRGPTTYRVFLLPEALQCDLSLTPAAQFRPAGPRFRLLFGQTAAGAAANDAGGGIQGLEHHLVPRTDRGHGRRCTIERVNDLRRWQTHPSPSPWTLRILVATIARRRVRRQRWGAGGVTDAAWARCAPDY